MYILPVCNWQVCPCPVGRAHSFIQPLRQPRNQRQEVLVVFSLDMPLRPTL